MEIKDRYYSIAVFYIGATRYGHTHHWPYYIILIRRTRASGKCESVQFFHGT